MSRKVRLLVLAVVMTSLLTGCAAAGLHARPAPGMVYASESGPITATSNAGSSKMGTATATSILGLFAWGDASISKAMANAQGGPITKIHHADMEVKNLLGIYATYTVKVYGE